MPLHVIDDKNRISMCQNRLANMLRKTGEPRDGKWGHQGGNERSKMYWFPDYGFWWAYFEHVQSSNPRHWNAFGLTEPVGDSTSHDIACEINIPLSSGTWKVAGAFAKDDKDETYIIHSGKIGGGRSGIGKNAFMRHFPNSQLVNVERDGKPRDAAVVSELDDPTLVQNLAHFVRMVDRIKKIAHKEKAQAPQQGVYRREFSGYRRSYSVKSEIHARVEHGKVVHEIRELAEGSGLDTTNNQWTDLILNGKRVALVEVKTDNIPYNRYTAIGQLLYHSKSDDCEMVAVFPAPIDTHFKGVLKKLGIVGVSWSRNGSTYKFGPELRKVLDRL